jgi:hypothetical protein
MAPRRSPWSLGDQIEADLTPIAISEVGEIRFERVAPTQTNIIFHAYGDPRQAVEMANELRELYQAHLASKQEAA